MPDIALLATRADAVDLGVTGKAAIDEARRGKRAIFHQRLHRRGIVVRRWHETQRIAAALHSPFALHLDPNAFLGFRGIGGRSNDTWHAGLLCLPEQGIQQRATGIGVDIDQLRSIGRQLPERPMYPRSSRKQYAGGSH